MIGSAGIFNETLTTSSAGIHLPEFTHKYVDHHLSDWMVDVLEISDDGCCNG